MSKYWIVSPPDSTLTESDRPAHCELDGLNLEPLDHASAARLAEEVAGRPQGVRFVLLKNYEGIASVPDAYAYDTEFTLAENPFLSGSSLGLDSYIHLTTNGSRIHNFCFSVGFTDSVWILFVVSDGGILSLAGAQRRLHKNLQGIFT